LREKEKQETVFFLLRFVGGDVVANEFDAQHGQCLGDVDLLNFLALIETLKDNSTVCEKGEEKNNRKGKKKQFKEKGYELPSRLQDRVSFLHTIHP
jgi:hypothetical protein